jgi:RNA polymerase sigma-54 factor
VIIRRTSTGYDIELTGNEHLSISVNAQYRAIYNEIRSGHASKYSDEEQKHILSCVDRADLLIRNINQRRKTLRSITKCIVDFQHGFLATGSKLFLRPFTRVKVAEILDMHESTVSRATANKYVQLPSEEVVPFDIFFHASQSQMGMVTQLLENEDSGDPLSDQDVADTLTEQGYPIARRTVAKYRKSLKILPSHNRRR